MKRRAPTVRTWNSTHAVRLTCTREPCVRSVPGRTHGPRGVVTCTTNRLDCFGACTAHPDCRSRGRTRWASSTARIDARSRERHLLVAQRTGMTSV
jgi:hypothetical protein